jgi:hypothetical protein
VEKKRARAATDDDEDKAKAKAATDDDEDKAKAKAAPDDDESGDDADSGDDDGSGDEDGSGDDDEKDKGKKKGKKDKAALILRAERERIAEITAMCRSFGISDKRTDQLIKDGTSEAEARKAIMDGYLKDLEKGPAFGGARVLHDERDKFRARAVDGLVLKAGGKVEKPAEGAREIRGMTLKELARECLAMRGHRPSYADPGGMVMRALSTSDLPALLEETGRRFLLDGFADAPETWHLWTGKGTAPDFKPAKLIDVSMDNELRELYQGSEYEQARMSEESEEYSVGTYGRIFSITRQSIINDDLGAFTTVPAQMGWAVARKIGDAVYGILAANDRMGDGKNLFDGTFHHNVITGGGVPTVDTLGAADLAMGTQRDHFEERRLNIIPEYFLAPLALRVSSETFFNSQLIGTAALPGVQNIYHGRFTRVYEPRLDDLNPNAWYLVGRKDMGVRVFYLNGVEEPYIEQDFTRPVDGVSYRVRFDFGAKAISWRAFVRSDPAN